MCDHKGHFSPLMKPTFTLLWKFYVDIFIRNVQGVGAKKGFFEDIEGSW